MTKRAVIFGASGGMGAAVAERLAQDPAIERLYLGSRQPAPQTDARLVPFPFDLTDEASIAAAAAHVEGPVDLVFVATGVLHQGPMLAPEKTYRALDAQAMAALFAVNTIGPALIARHFLPLLPRDGRGVFAALSARVGSIGDNRLGGWHSYRASKAALNMLLANFAIELRRTHPQAIVAGLHPGTVDSALSAPFQRGVAPEKLFTPAQSAAYLVDVLDRLRPEDSGGIFAWDGARIPY
ncbi:SDR family NAD(P)-dependent oxidoreductase [Sphingomonas sp. R1]|uniref:SDR family NAD(P)-dependent oxidoreductase n=1 Tax=Sphingomonas sp. R1 TaxID=399176 RepID=UPI00222465F2|nr:SDR family NAD(P)-dependent oxidoreductase [Sphingomonas sp. R1]UYY77993.1 SDR family NAD(P)-dependent oxidoreductase [Sphingomonas sp. R1]